MNTQKGVVTLSMNIKFSNITEKLLPAVLLIAIGFLAGGESYKYTQLNQLNTSIKESYDNNLLNAKDYLILAKAIRSEKYDEALSYSEQLLENSLKSLPSETIKSDNVIIGQIKDYKEKDCQNQCLHHLSL